MDIQTTTIIASLSAIVAAVSSLVTVWNYRREQLNQKIAAAKWKKEYFADLLKWSDEAIFLLSDAMHLCELDPTKMDGTRFFDLRHALRVKLSAQIDRGRWFFPNYKAEGVGGHKKEAYRGYRHEVLDGLVAAYRQLCVLDYKDASKNHACREGVEDAKRTFTTEIQRTLDPRSRDREFKILLGSVADS